MTPKTQDQPANVAAPEAKGGSSATIGSAIFAEVAAELERAMKKHPTWPSEPLHALAVLGEEYGELTQAMLQLCYEPEKSSRERVREEAIQTAAMAIRLAMSLGRYQYYRMEQHSQNVQAHLRVGERNP
jgi:NTP pyrophosphatase (non-canonical NTP hydrolase)